MYELFIANKNYTSWSLRPWVLMRELRIPFTQKLIPFAGKGEPNTFRAFSPSGKVPCLVDGSTAVWDSLAIAEFLAERVPEVWPTDSVARTWARCAAAQMHSGFTALRDACSMNCGVRVRIDPPLSAGSIEYANRLLSLPSMQEWYVAALNETWRDEQHEDEARRAGTLLQDLRSVAT